MTTKWNSAKVLLGLACLSLLVVCVACGSGGAADPTGPTTVSNIQNQSGWTGCTGPSCAGGVGNATYSLIQGESSPSMDGMTAEFQLGGATGLSNVAWTKTLPASDSATEFTLDLQAYVDCGCWPQSLSFGVSQVTGGQDYSFKYECDFDGTGDWNLWDPAHQVWADTGLACSPLAPKGWTHLVFQMERANGQLHYKGFSVNSQSYPLNIYFNPGARTPDALEVHFDEGGDSVQDPYSVWLDQVTLTVQ